MTESDYTKFRGKCKEFTDQLIISNPTLTQVRGWYHCPYWGTQGHWWCKDQEGNIIDPTKDQFPSKGMGVYEEFDGMVECESCGTKVKEEDAYFNGHHAYCSGDCFYRDVM